MHDRLLHAGEHFLGVRTRVALREGVIEDEEPAPFGGSPAGTSFGIKPQDDLFATEIP